MLMRTENPEPRELGNLALASMEGNSVRPTVMSHSSPLMAAMLWEDASFDPLRSGIKGVE